MLHVPYKGSAPALNDLIAGRVDVMFDYPVSVGPRVEDGKLKILATTAPEDAFATLQTRRPWPNSA